jgi:hypothetical protein
LQAANFLGVVRVDVDEPCQRVDRGCPGLREKVRAEIAVRCDKAVLDFVGEFGRLVRACDRLGSEPGFISV